jgi:hypothetical protein
MPLILFFGLLHLSFQVRALKLGGNALFAVLNCVAVDDSACGV